MAWSQMTWSKPPKSRGALAGVPGHSDHRTPATWEDSRVPSDSANADGYGPADFGPADFAAADDIVRHFFLRGVAPGISYGIVRDGELVHAAGVGGVTLLGAAPDERTVFRIASMSKSF